MLFGGNTGGDETWEFDGSRWLKARPLVSPSARVDHALAYDAARGRTLLFGGQRAPYLNDLWSFDSTSWTEKSPAPRPSGGDWAAAYDSARQKTVFVGGPAGCRPCTGLMQTWEWDGTSFSDRSTTTGPPARTRHVIAYDALRGRTVLFGGQTYDSDFGYALNDTWEWDGTAWRQALPATSPSPRGGPALTYDARRGEILLVGGYPQILTATDTWGWDGTSWTQKPWTSNGFRVAFGAVTFDAARGVAVLLNPGSYTSPLQTWEWDGTSWTQRFPASSPPYGSASVAYDGARNRTLLLGYSGCNPTCPTAMHLWEWDGTNWTERTPPSPEPRSRPAFAYDAGRGETILFGGQAILTQDHDDTWEWDGTNWTERSSAVHPSARHAHALAYDPVRRTTLLYGGATGGNETWVWDGTTWSQKTPSTSPSVGSGTLVFDEPSGWGLLINGYGMWKWDGTTWTSGATFPPSSPFWQQPFPLAVYDSAAALTRAFLWSGASSTVYSFDGTTFSTPLSASGPESRVGGAVAFDRARGRTVLFGGEVARMLRSETWEFHTSGGACTTGAGCPTGNCIDGVCCETVSCGTCEACNLPGSPGVCAKLVSVVDPNSCSGTRACGPSGACSLVDGQPCGAAQDCVSGFCVDGVCCKSASCATCQACNLSADLGTCSAVRNADDADSCPVSTHTCGASSACKLKLGQSCAQGADCANGPCVDGYCCDGACSSACDACDGGDRGWPAATNGGCAIAPAADPGAPACSPYLCAGTSAVCPAACTSDAACDATAYCAAGGVCRVRKPQAARCDAAAGADCLLASCRVCSSPGGCVDGFCCNDACAGGCNACNGASRGWPGASDGSCGVAPAGDPGDPICATALCTGTAPLCPGECVTNADCSETAWCDASTTPPRCQPKRGDGESCSSAAECETGICVDGVCCAAPCTGQCEACDLAGKLGTCVPVTGSPHGARTACETSNEPCLAASCDGSDRTKCAGRAGPEVICRMAGCVDGQATLPAVCDGKGHCPVPVVQPCAPFECGADACLTGCTIDTDCAAGFQCVLGRCEAGLKCDGDHTLVGRDSAPVDCAPFRCTAANTCSTVCGSTADCAAGYSCTVKGACAKSTYGSASDSGCGCRVLRGETPAGRGPWIALLLTWLAVARERRGRGQASLASIFVSLAAVTSLSGCSGESIDVTVGSRSIAASTAVGTAVWQKAPLMPARSLHGLAYDPVRRRSVLFGGMPELGDTWEWDGTSFVEIAARSDLPPRDSFGFAHDAARGKTLLFGGRRSGVWVADTWQWDGTVWTELSTATAPPPMLAQMAFDSRRGIVVLFGGDSGSGFSDTWEWDGTSWTQRLPPDSPAFERYGHALAYDAARGVTVLFGGTWTYNWTDIFNDTWEWDGTTWTARAPSMAPAPRQNHALAYDSARSRIVLFGGETPDYLTGGTLPFDDTWEWDGTTWIELQPATRPPARSGHRMTYDVARARVLMQGGAGSFFGNDAWEWDGTNWTRVVPEVPLPGAPYEPALVYDEARGSTLLIGGTRPGTTLSDLWAWDGTIWTALSPPTAPPARYLHAVAYDRARNRTVLFGGSASSLGFNDTWEWDGTAWAQAQPVSRPGGRDGHGLAYDVARRKTVLFGGRSGQFGLPPLDDTWEWDGTNWRQAFPAVKPSPRSALRLAYDEARARVVLFGGNRSNGPSNEVWEWDGVTWTNVTPVGTLPAARSATAFGYDALRRQFIVFGGLAAGSTRLDDTWSWDGTSFGALAAAVAPAPRSGPALAFDRRRSRFVLFGGFDGRSQLGDTWELHVNGGACATGAECGTGHCVDGACCEKSACGTCETCSAPAGAGVCSAVRDAGDPDSCSGTRACGPTALCRTLTGAPCAGSNECLSGHCVDGTCCGEASCPATCSACNVPGSLGRCGPVLSADDADTCSGTTSCDATGACKAKNGESCSDGASCASGFCADGVCCNTACSGACDACNGMDRGFAGAVNGACIVDPRGQPGTPTCAPFLCDGSGSACPASCAGDTDCVSTAYCAASAQCKPRKVQGEPCNDAPGSDCLAGNCRVCDSGGGCIDGYCCDAACAGGCNACNGADYGWPAATSGVCTLAPVGAPGNPTCSPNVCSGSSALCPGECLTSTDCTTSGWCSAGKCSPKLVKGEICVADEACTSGHCVDGRCCNVECSGQCEACDVARAEGTCVPISDAPHNARAPCAAGTVDNPCAARACDGIDGSKCARFAGSDVTCRTAHCENGQATLVTHCDGSGTCPAPVTKSCEPFACGVGVCETSCRDDADCAANYRCQDGRCVDRAHCDGDHTLVGARASQNCAPFRCTVDDVCLNACASNADCVSGLSCTADGACVSPVPPSSGNDDSGCGCRLGAPASSTRRTTLIALALLAFVRQRRRKLEGSGGRTLEMFRAATGSRSGGT